MNLSALKTQFLEHLEIEKGRSLHTIENYDRYLSRFLAETKAVDPAAITDDTVRKFRLWLNRQEGRKEGRDAQGLAPTMKKRSQNYYMIALRQFLRYLARMNIPSLPPDRIDLAKVPERHLDLISAEELVRLLAAPDGSDTRSLRDRAILELLFSTGLRVSELCSLSRDLDIEKDEFSIRGKGEKVRVVFLSEEAKSAVRAYLSARKDLEDPLFIEHSSRKSRGEKVRSSLRLTPRSIERIVKKYAIKAGITRKVTPHIIRHSFATDLLQNGADIRSVQALLGHSNIVTTQIYTHVTDRGLRDIHKQFHGKYRQ